MLHYARPRHVCPLQPTCSHATPLRGQLVEDVEQAAEQQLLGVLHAGVIGRARLQTPEDRSDPRQNAGPVIDIQNPDVT